MVAFVALLVVTVIHVFRSNGEAAPPSFLQVLKTHSAPSARTVSAARQRLEVKAKRGHKWVHSNSLDATPDFMKPLDGVAQAVTMMTDQERVAKARALVKEMETERKNPVYNHPVRRISTTEFAEREMRALENHLR